jgi:NADP-dependent 3-hydroxy acid dehydrogenase YdfG
VKDHPTTVIPVQLKSADKADGQATAQTIKDQVGKIDVIIANAGKPAYFPYRPRANLADPSLQARAPVIRL